MNTPTLVWKYDESWLQAAARYMSNCDPPIASEIQSFYIKLWECTFATPCKASNNSHQCTPALTPRSDVTTPNDTSEARHFLDSQVDATTQDKQEQLIRSAEILSEGHQGGHDDTSAPQVVALLDSDYLGAGQVPKTDIIELSMLGELVPYTSRLLLKSHNEVERCLQTKHLYDMPNARPAKILRYDSKEKIENWKIGFAGSCEILIQRQLNVRPWNPTLKPSLPFENETLLMVLNALHLPLKWLAVRPNDCGICYVEGSIHNDRSYVIQTPIYKTGGVWTLAFTVRNPRGAAPKEPEYMCGTAEAEECEEGTSAVKTLGVFEVNAHVELANIMDEVRIAAAKYRHPLLLPIQMLDHHVQESARRFMAISWELTKIEDAIDPSAIDSGNTSPMRYGALSKRLYQCSNDLVELERRRDFEGRLAKLLLKDVCVGTNEEFGKSYAVSYWIYERNMPRLEAIAQRIEAIMETGDHRSLDMQSLPRRIDGLTILIRNLVAQQDSQANIQIARLTLQENNQMRTLTKASLEIAKESRRIAKATQRDSDAMKKIAALTTAFLPGTYVASLFSTSMFSFSEPNGPIISEFFWIYVLVALPLTICVFAGLQLWMRHRKPKAELEDADGESEPASGNATAVAEQQRS